MQLNAVGRIVEEEWLRTAVMRPGLTLDEHIAMPNHLHAIVVVVKEPPQQDDHRSPLRHNGPSSGSLGSIIAGFKSAVTRRINGYDPRIAPIWQRNYYEHIIRSDKSLSRIRGYVMSNPLNWTVDCENPAAIRSLKATEPWQQ